MYKDFYSKHKLTLSLSSFFFVHNLTSLFGLFCLVFLMGFGNAIFNVNAWY